MTKLRIEYERPSCIGAGSCAVVAPDFFFMDDDGKATLQNSKEENNLKILEIEADEATVKRMVEAAQSCPVNIIKVKDLSTGKQLV